MDAFPAVVSKREVRRYDARQLDEDSSRRVLEAGRVAGSAANRPYRRFVVLGDRDGCRRGRVRAQTTSAAPPW